MKSIILAIAFVASVPAFAQQTPMEQAMGAKLLAELGASLQCTADAVATRAALDRALARVKELEAKSIPDPEVGTIDQFAK
jgi:hypothetical protein